MKKIYLINLFCSLIIMSCSIGLDNPGWQKIYDKDFENAYKYFQDAYSSNPNDPDISKGLGVSQLMLKNYVKAEEYLQTSFSLKKDDPETILYLGICFSVKNDPKEAINYFNKSIAITDDKNLKSKAEVLLDNEKRKIYTSQITDAITNEKNITNSDVLKGSIAVLPFINFNSNGEYDVLKKGIAEMLITHFGLIKNISILERVQIEELMKEIKLSQTKMIDSKTANRMGKLLRTESFVTGGYSILPDNNFNMSIYTFNIQDGQMSKICERKGSLKEFFPILKDLTLIALDQLNVTITEEERKKIKTFPTEDFFEFLVNIRKKYREENEILLDRFSWILNKIVAKTDLQNEVLQETPIKKVSSISQAAVVGTPKDVKTKTLPVEVPSLGLPPSFFPVKR